MYATDLPLNAELRTQSYIARMANDIIIVASKNLMCCNTVTCSIIYGATGHYSRIQNMSFSNVPPLTNLKNAM